MPGKSRSRGNYSPQSKKKKKRVDRPVASAGQPAVTPVPDLSVSPESPSALAIKPVAVANPCIGRELRTIAILAVTMVIILLILASLLS